MYIRQWGECKKVSVFGLKLSMKQVARVSRVFWFDKKEGLK